MTNFMNRSRLVALSGILAFATLATACAGNDAKVAGPAKATAALNEWSVKLSSTTFKPGKYSFTISNDGKAEHELIAVKTDLPLANLPLKADGGVNEESPALPNATDGDDILVGKSQVRTIDLTAPGSYVFMCNLPAHFKQGMHEVITVTA